MPATMYAADQELAGGFSQILRRGVGGGVNLPWRGVSPASVSLLPGGVNPLFVGLHPFDLCLAGLKFEGTITRFTLPIRCLSFSASGSILAAAGDDEGIKLISTLDCSIACILKVSRGDSARAQCVTLRSDTHVPYGLRGRVFKSYSAQGAVPLPTALHK